MSNFDPATLHNPYFNQKLGQKDIWTLINETAAEAQKESGKSIVNLGQDFSLIIHQILLLKQSTRQLVNPNLINMHQQEVIQTC